MIILTDANDIVFSAMSGGMPDLSEPGYSGVYEVEDTFRARDCINRPLSEFIVINTIATQVGTHNQLGAIKGVKSGIINVACRNQIIAGFESSALGTVHHYPFDPEDQSNLMSTFMLAKELSVDKPFKCWDSAGVVGYRMHTVAQLQQVGQDAETHKMAALTKAATLKAQVNAATTAAEVEAIVW